MPVAATLALVFFTSLFAALFILPATITMAHRFRYLDFPEGGGPRGEAGRKKLHVNAIPRIGGIGMILSFFISTVIWVDLGPFTTIMIGSFLLFAVGLWDDFKALPARFRLVTQVLVASWVILSCDLSLTNIVLFESNIDLPSSLGFFLAIFCVVGAVNAINMIDGLDGLAAGVSLICIIMLSCAHYLVTKQALTVTIITLALMGSIIGFLRYNSHPAKLFMGDGGSTWLGYMLGITILLALGGFNIENDTFVSVGRPVPFITVALVLAVPVFDTFGVMLKRILQGNSPFSADENHFHHILLNAGLGQKRCVTSIYFLSLLLSTIGVFKITYAEYYLGWMTYFTLILAAVFIVGTKYSPFYKRLKTALSIAATSRRKTLSGDRLRIIRYWAGINKYAIYLILAFSPLVATGVSVDAGYISAALAGMLFVSLFIGSSDNDFMHALLISVSCAMILFAINTVPVQILYQKKIVNGQPFYNGIFIFLAISVVLYYLTTLNRQYLKVTPTDFLFIAIPLVMLLIPEPWQSKYYLGPISARCFVIFLALRSIKNFRGGVARRFKVLAMWALGIIALRSVFGISFVV